MDYVGLAKRLIEALVSDIDSVSIKEFPSESDDRVEIQVLVSESDMKRVIGKGGKNINAVRTILQAASNLHDHKYIHVNIEGV